MLPLKLFLDILRPACRLPVPPLQGHLAYCYILSSLDDHLVGQLTTNEATWHNHIAMFCYTPLFSRWCSSWTTNQLPLQVLRRLLPGVHLVLQRAHLVQLVQYMVLGRKEKHLALLSEKLHGKTFNLVLANLSRASAFKMCQSHFDKRLYYKTFLC